ncbi:MAG: glycoside hydrolase family 9 protein [Lachnospiraceae bacterium]|nr:glycoside hydrolase family 9 protein [Lachnospiraceae bacterium]
MRRFKRLTSLLLASVMVLSLAGCGGKGEEATTEMVTEATEAATEATEEATTEEVDLEAMGNLIQNGDFAGGNSKWSVYTNGGICTSNVKNEELQVDIAKIGGVEHGVQIYQDGFALDNGVKYRFEFDVRCTMERDFDWRLQINGGDYHAYASQTITATTEMQHVSYEFEMTEASDPAPRLCFNMGYVDAMEEAGLSFVDMEEHTVWIDNVSLEVVDASGIVNDKVEVDVPKVKVNQVGYETEADKIAVFSDLAEDDTTFTVVDAKSGDVAFEGDITTPVENASAGEKNSKGDFSGLTKAGTYKVVTGGGEESYEFTIGGDVYAKSYNSVVKMLYLQRCGCELTEDLAGDFAHPVCHNTEAVVYGTDTKVDVSGGWHDAGDYGRYVVPAAKTIADLLLAFEENPEAFGDNCGIPESGNGINDALDEARYELEWMLKMQDPTGGVYHKVTCDVFPETVMPQDEVEELICAPISKTATASFAAIMAYAGRIYSENGDAEFGNKCIEAAKKAWTFALGNKKAKGYRNPSDIVTGEYPDTNSNDEYFWAGIELYKATGDTSYLAETKEAYAKVKSFGGFGWANISGYAEYAALTSDKLSSDDAAFYSEIEKNFFGAVDAALVTSKANPYMINKEDSYEWGSNLSIANTGMMFYLANNLKSNEEYIAYANAHLNYLYGVNATGYCFVTGVGTLYPEHPHHRPSEVLEKCMPGMLVGGPNSGLEDPYAKAVFVDYPAAKCYEDNAQAYSANEITIYWNSPLIYLLTATRK